MGSALARSPARASSFSQANRICPVIAAVSQSALSWKSTYGKWPRPASFPVRNLSLHAALGRGTVARVLELLWNEDDPLIDLVSRRQLARADRYQLRIPDRYADSVRWRRRRPGRIEAIHPVFLVHQARPAWCTRCSARPRCVVLRSSGRPGFQRRRPRPRSGCSLSTGLLNAALMAGVVVSSPWPTSPKRPARPHCPASERRVISKTAKAGGPGSGSTREPATGIRARETAGGAWTMRTSTTRYAGGRC